MAIVWQVDGTAAERRRISAERRSEEMLTDLVNVASVSEEILSGWVLVLYWIYCMMSKLFIVSCLTK